EAMRGGRGDRLILGTPRRLLALPTAFGAIAAVVLFGAIHDRVRLHHLAPAAMITLPFSAALVGLYLWVGWCLWRTQTRRHREIGGWSVSGLSLSLVFPTRALTHAAYSLAGATAHHTL